MTLSSRADDEGNASIYVVGHGTGTVRTVRHVRTTFYRSIFSLFRTLSAVILWTRRSPGIRTGSTVVRIP